MNKDLALKDNILGTAPVTKLIIKFAFPAFLGMLVGSIYNITDQMFIGKIIGMYGNAATNVTFPINNITMALAQMIGIGASSGFNLNLGGGNPEKAKKYITNGLSLMVFFSIVILVAFNIFREPLMWLCGATENSISYSLEYFGVTLWGLPCMIFVSSFGMIIRADGSPNYAMACIASGAAINIFLDWLFMVPMEMGMTGAAVATVIGQVISTVMSLAYLFRFKAFKISRKDFKPQPEFLASIVKLGVPGFVTHSLMMVVNITLNNVLVKYGAMSVYGEDIPLAVAGVIHKVFQIVICVAVGLAQGSQPIWAFNMGAKNYARVREAWKKAVIVEVAIAMVFFALFQLFPRQIVSIFGSGDELYYQFAELYFRKYLMAVGIFGIEPISCNYFSAIGEYKTGTLISLSREGVFLLPLLLILPKYFGMNGILYSCPIADVSSVILSLIFVAINFKKLKEKEAQ